MVEAKVVQAYPDHRDTSTPKAVSGSIEPTISPA